MEVKVIFIGFLVILSKLTLANVIERSNNSEQHVSGAVLNVEDKQDKLVFEEEPTIATRGGFFDTVSKFGEEVKGKARQIQNKLIEIKDDVKNTVQKFIPESFNKVVEQPTTTTTTTTSLSTTAYPKLDIRIVFEDDDVLDSKSSSSSSTSNTISTTTNQAVISGLTSEFDDDDSTTEITIGDRALFDAPTSCPENQKLHIDGRCRPVFT